MISNFFINRPVFSTVIGIIIVILGFLSLKSLPISQLPNLTPPTVVVSAQYPGASAETIANNILTPLESQIAGIDGLMYMSSKASGLSGSGSITCTFEIGTDQDMAAVEIQNRINVALPQLPQTTRDLGVNIQKRTSDILLIVAITSPDESMDSTQISNYISTNLLDEIKRIPGAGQSQIFGQRDYAIRIWLDPNKMASLGVSSTEIAAAIKEQNLQVAPGRLGQAPSVEEQLLTIQLTADGRLSTPQEFENIIIRAKNDGSMIKVKDVAKVELGTNNYEFFGRVKGKPAAMIGIFADVNANALDTSDAVKAKMAELAKKFPDGIVYDIPYDTTDFVKISIKEVVSTLIEAILLVSFVIYIFLQSFRSAIIPILSIPISLMGAFIGMYLLGYSVNTLTLFGLVLAIGIVVDDAIIVIENMERILQSEDISPYKAAIKAMSQITAPLIAIVLVMCAVFIPSTFMGGMTGQLYKQFASTIAISVAFSGFMAISFAPSIAALILKKHHHEPRGFFRWFNNFFEKMTNNYVRRSMFMIRKFVIFGVLYLSTYGFIWFFNSTLPKAFLPMEDQGYFIVNVNLPEAATTNRTFEVVKQVENILENQDGIAKYTAITGLNILTFSQEPNSAVVFVRLKDWSERTTKETSLFGILEALGPKLGSINEAKVFAMPPPPIRGMGPSDMFSMRLLQPGNNDIANHAQNVNAFIAELRNDPKIANVFTTMNISSPTLKIDVDREKVKALNVNINELFATLQSTIGVMYINQFDKNGKTYWVQLQSDAQFRQSPEDIGKAWVRSNNNTLVPLSSLINVTLESAPSSIEHFNGMLSATVMGSPAPMVSSGDIINILEQKANTILPRETSYAWEGIYFQEKQVGSKAIVLLAFALLMVYLILSALYEKWILPISIMLAVPYAILGAYAVVWLIPWLNNTVYFQIGLLALVALSAKNAILVVEFAEELREQGKSILEATQEAARLRFRPMMMTSFAFLAGMLPLIFSSGAGSGSRFAIGVAMFGGMLSATFIERYFIPYLYYVVASIQDKLKSKRGVANG